MLLIEKANDKNRFSNDIVVAVREPSIIIWRTSGQPSWIVVICYTNLIFVIILENNTFLRFVQYSYTTILHLVLIESCYK